MLKCSSCENTGKRQCKTCEGKLFCDSCTQKHINYHENIKTDCLFGRIGKKNSKEKLKIFWQKVNESLRTIEKQKKSIIEEALKLTIQIENLVKSSLEKLDQMSQDYYIIANRLMFDEQAFIRAEEIME